MTNEFAMKGAALLAGLTAALMGWYGWVLIVFCATMVLDYLTGTAAAVMGGSWASQTARLGIWHKVGSIMTVAAAMLADGLIGLCAGNLELSLRYSVLISPIVTVWYIVTEFGSILENCGKMGAPVPGFLTKAIASMQKGVEGEENEKNTER